MPSYTAKTRNVGRRPRSKRLRELGGSVTINNGSAPDLDGYELLSNKVAEVDSDSTDEQYPTAKCLYDALADIATAIEGLSSVFSAIGHVHAIGDITGLQSALDGKAAADHTHSGYAASSHSHAISDITNLQTTLDGKAASNHTHAITDTTGTLPISRGGTGKTTGADACNALLNSLSIGDSNPVDNDYYISQYVNGGTTSTTYHRRPVSKLWNYIKSKADSIYAAASHTHSQYLTSHQTVTNKAATIGTSLTTIATIGGTNITAKIGSYAAASHTHSYLPLSGGTMTGNILGGATAALGTTASPFHQLVLGGATNATMGASTGNPRITFVEETGTQPVHLVYTDYDSYRSPAGLKVVGNSSASSSPAWFEVEGKMYAAGMELRDQTITASKTVLEVTGNSSAPASSTPVIYGIKASLSADNHGISTQSAAVYGIAVDGCYAGLFSGSVKVSSSLTANSVSAATIYQTSDDRLKDYCGEFHFALADLERIPLRLFRFKADREGKVLIGTSAQAVQKVLPEIVGSGRTASEDDTEEYLNVDYSKLAIVALDCVRQLRDEVAALRREIDELKRGR